MKNVLKVLIVASLVVSFSLVSGTGFSASKKITIGITNIVSAPPLLETKRGFFAAMEKHGYNKSNTIYLDKVAEGDMSLCASIAQSFVQQEVDLIFSITTPSSQAAVAAAKGTDIPIVFAAVTAPAEAGLVDSWEKPGGNVTGVSDRMNVPAQADLIKVFVPNARRIGTIYNTGEVNSMVQVRELKEAAADLGYEIIEAVVASSPELIPAAKSLVGRVDAIWVPTDNIINLGLEAVVKVCEDNKIPLFGSDVHQVPRGEIAALGIEMFDVGYVAGEKAVAILKGQKKPFEIPVTGAVMNLLWVYPQQAKRMGVKVPQIMIAKADKVVKDK